MAAKDDGKWRLTATEVIPAHIDKVWPILSQFDGFLKNFPEAFSASDIIEGEGNNVGSVRVLVAPLPNGEKLEVTERLLHFDDVNHTTSYNMEKCNHGWTGYAGHVSAKSFEDGKTLVSWGCEVDPISGDTEEEFLPRQKGFFEFLLQLLTKKVSE